MASHQKQQLVLLIASTVLSAVALVSANSRSQQLHNNNDPNKYCTCNEAFINRRGFPDGFIFGSGSAAYQVEGGYNESGKATSMWDHFTHTYPDKIQDGTNGDVAVDSYHLYKEDVQILKNMGFFFFLIDKMRNFNRTKNYKHQ
ncbi:hypothetical protein ACP275_13G191300 [Erythranthe tilingii]